MAIIDTFQFEGETYHMETAHNAPSYQRHLLDSTLATLLKHYSSAELEAFHATTFQELEKELKPHVEAFHDAIVNELNELAGFGIHFTKDIQDLETSMLDTMHEVQSNFTQRIYQNIAQVAERDGHTPLAWALHAGDESVETILEDMQKYLQETQTYLTEV